MVDTGRAGVEAEARAEVVLVEWLLGIERRDDGLAVAAAVAVVG